MPYIKQEDRMPTLNYGASKAGELNFAITRLIKRYLDRGDVNYQVINDVIGAVEGAKLEFYRRVVVPYEDRKIQENGDVY